MTRRSPDAIAGLSRLIARHAARQPPEDISRVAAEFGSIAVDCTVAAIARDPEEIVQGSAAFLDALFRLWRDQDLDPAAVWHELHARIEMGELSFRLSRTPGRHRSRRAGPWRVATSKLP